MQEEGGGYHFEFLPIYTNAAGANLASSDSLRTRPVFKHSPTWLTNLNYSLSAADVDFMLGMGIPALTPSTGRTIISSINPQQQLNLNGSADPYAMNFKPNGWPTASHGGMDAGHWLHNDMKDVAYFFNYPLPDMIVDEGGLR